MKDLICEVCLLGDELESHIKEDDCNSIYWCRDHPMDKFKHIYLQEAVMFLKQRDCTLGGLKLTLKEFTTILGLRGLTKGFEAYQVYISST